MEEKIKKKNKRLLKRLMRKMGISEKKFDDIWQECVDELGENKWSKMQVANMLMGHWMGDTMGNLLKGF